MATTDFLDDLLFGDEVLSPRAEWLRTFNAAPNYIRPGSRRRRTSEESLGDYAKRRGFDTDALTKRECLANQDPSRLRLFLQEFIMVMLPCYFFELSETSLDTMFTPSSVDNPASAGHHNSISVTRYVWLWMGHHTQNFFRSIDSLLPEKQTKRSLEKGEVEPWEQALAMKLIFARERYESTQYFLLHLLDAGLIDVVSKGMTGGMAQAWSFIYSLQVAGECIGHCLLKFQRQVCEMLYRGSRFKEYWSAVEDVEVELDAMGVWMELIQPISVSWGENPRLEELVDHSLLCPSQIAQLTASDASSLLLSWLCAVFSFRNQAALMDQPRSHASCKNIKCGELDVDKETYTTRHVSPGCKCDFFGPDIDTVKTILRAGETPLLILRRASASDPYPTSVAVQPSRTAAKYVAISHVWSDGLGNKLTNKLPRCQLHRISRLIGEGMPFWMDTLCIPVGDANKEVRDIALSTMNVIYYKATWVNVLSNDLGPANLRGLSMMKEPGHTALALLAICNSAWSTRLWTLHEAVYGGKRVRVSFGNELTICIREAAMKDSKSHTWLQNYIESVLVQTLDTRVTTKTGANAGIALYSIFSQCRWRRTTKAKDEALIIAGLLGVKTQPVIQAPRDDIDRRMEVLYSRLTRFPVDVLFCQAPRLNVVGRRWAPRTLCIPDWCTDSYLENWVKSVAPGWADRTGEIWPGGLNIRACSLEFDLPGDQTVLPSVFQLRGETDEDEEDNKNRSAKLRVQLRGVGPSLNLTSWPRTNEVGTDEPLYELVILLNNRETRRWPGQPESFGDGALAVVDHYRTYGRKEETEPRLKAVLGKFQSVFSSLGSRKAAGQRTGEYTGPDEADSWLERIRDVNTKGEYQGDRHVYCHWVCPVTVTRGYMRKIERDPPAESYNALWNYQRQTFVVD